MKASNKPDFLCIGPHKTGTTWVYAKLYWHPEIWLPPQKELWVLNLLGLPYYKQIQNLLTRAGMQGNMRRSFERDYSKLLANPKNFLHAKTYSRLWWWIIYLFLPYRFTTYSSLFPRQPALVTGDITPNYYFLNKSVICQLQKRYPQLKIIIILRNPVDRVWSYALMDAAARHQKPIDRFSENELTDYFDEIHTWWKPYPDRINLWQSYFPNTFIAYFDELQNSPSKFHDQICQFLGTDTFTFTKNLSQKVNASKTILPSKTIKRYLVGQYIDEVRELARRENNIYVTQWLSDMEQFLD